MPKQVEFFYDFTSPTAYLAWARLPAIAQRTGAKIIYRPMFLGVTRPGQRQHRRARGQQFVDHLCLSLIHI